ncbi:twin-arginine translocase TatA/TatE family subunit [Flavobacterium pallidum]|uniref:Sec-independent protein translocase protein TatA n=1 Tax=Flavobacterium pallidum TaxID=2172098 RepID=A0A2S1SFD6_9FLAO|nr:twin-arginine translocase TatA/TatE family subunit [Flavobacterium pallidum]AWI25089.1 twin-arginine translocase TatA/TatE family subunit [Flavobacterium pallidum]
MNILYVFLGEITPMKVILVLAIVLLMFGGKKIPELMRGLGSGVKEFKNAAKGEDEAPAAHREDEKI